MTTDPLRVHRWTVGCPPALGDRLVAAPGDDAALLADDRHPAAGQQSVLPRLLQTFVRDRVVQTCPGVLLGTFVHALVVLRTVRSG